MLHKQRWTSEKIAQRLALITPLVYRRRLELPPFSFMVLDGPEDERAAFLINGPLGQWPPIEPGSYWGGQPTNFVLRSAFVIPADWDASYPVELYLPLGEAGDFSHPEALVYVDGRAHAGCDRHHQEVRLRDEWRDGQSHALALQGWTGLGGAMSPGAHAQLLMRPCAVVQIDQPLRDFVATARTALGVANAIDEDEPARGRLLNALDAAFKTLDTREPHGESFYASVGEAHAVLEDGTAAAGPPLDVDIYAAGHAHLDVAWLWTLGQTRRKAERTFYTALHLMEQFPEYRFTQSQPQLYDYVRQSQPALFEAIKRRVGEGRWEPIGGMWVEADCNISGGESLVRQLLLGRRFFREHFGPAAESPVLWLPDVFGYAWNLPQLIKGAGLDYFFTIKIGWSQYNRMPYDSFWWQGLDGTRVLTHFSPTREPGHHFASTYNSKADAAETISTWTNFQQKEQSQELLMAFGYGDGGGGPTREMLENIREMGNFPAMPRVRHASVIDFFRALEANSADALPVWKGELYLEYHRGTYTTQARNKRANRRAEFLLHNAEFLATLAEVVSLRPSAIRADGFSYPREKLRQAWELVCLNQFHDIIPGSSIAEVYTESLAQYREVQGLIAGVIDDAMEALGRVTESEVLLVNPNSRALTSLVFVPADFRMAPPATSQPVAGGFLVQVDDLAPYSVNGLVKKPIRPHTLGVSTRHLENDYLRLELDEAGDICRIYDKEQDRELLPQGAIANQFQAFEDRAKAWDAWDIDIYYDDRMWPAEPAESIEIVEDGPLRATLEINRRILNSSYTQRISLTHFSRRVDFDTQIDWREKHILLKVAFPVDLLAPAATYEIQWGHVERPTHRNTSWDWARFETAAQKWVDVSEGNYGVSLLNDCKYGHDIQDAAPAGTVMRLSLLRSPTQPDPTADQGTHEFRYSLLPHTGRVGAETITQAYALNNPPFAYHNRSPLTASGTGNNLPIAQALVHSPQPNIVIETVKWAEDGDGLIVRLYESLRQRGPVTLHAGFPLAAAWRTNLLEENQSELIVIDDALQFTARPFQIITLRLRPETA